MLTLDKVLSLISDALTNDVDERMPALTLSNHVSHDTKCHNSHYKKNVDLLPVFKS